MLQSSSIHFRSLSHWQQLKAAQGGPIGPPLHGSAGLVCARPCHVWPCEGQNGGCCAAQTGSFSSVCNIKTRGMPSASDEATSGLAHAFRWSGGAQLGATACAAYAPCRKEGVDKTGQSMEPQALKAILCLHRWRMPAFKSTIRSTHHQLHAALPADVACQQCPSFISPCCSPRRT